MSSTSWQADAGRLGRENEESTAGAALTTFVMLARAAGAELTAKGALVFIFRISLGAVHEK
jgi:hypothetical protein